MNKIKNYITISLVLFVFAAAGCSGQKGGTASKSSAKKVNKPEVVKVEIFDPPVQKQADKAVQKSSPPETKELSASKVNKAEEKKQTAEIIKKEPFINCEDKGFMKEEMCEFCTGIPGAQCIALEKTDSGEECYSCLQDPELCVDIGLISEEECQSCESDEGAECLVSDKTKDGIQCYQCKQSIVEVPVEEPVQVAEKKEEAVPEEKVLQEEEVLPVETMTEEIAEAVIVDEVKPVAEEKAVEGIEQSVQEENQQTVQDIPKPKEAISNDGPGWDISASAVIEELPSEKIPEAIEEVAVSEQETVEEVAVLKQKTIEKDPAVNLSKILEEEPASIAKAPVFPECSEKGSQSFSECSNECNGNCVIQEDLLPGSYCFRCEINLSGAKCSDLGFQKNCSQCGDSEICAYRELFVLLKNGAKFEQNCYQCVDIL